MKIYNAPQNKAQAIVADHKINNIISIYSPNVTFPIFTGVRNSQVLRLCFNDIIRPYDNLKIITQNDIERIINFVIEKGRRDILVHCYAGVSRSIAVTMLLIFLLEKNIKVDELVSFIKHKAPFANPNKLVLIQAGRVLHEEKFFEALAKHFKGKNKIIKAREFYIEL